MKKEDLTKTIKRQINEIKFKGFSMLWIKIPSAYIIVSLDYIFGKENHQEILMLSILIIIDLFTAIFAEYKSKNPIESRKILKTATKFVIYYLMIAGSHLTEAILPGSTFIDNAVICFLATTELISILENIGKSGYAIPQKLLNKLDELKYKQ